MGDRAENLERFSVLLVAAPERQQALLKDAEVVEVDGLEDLALHDGEIDLGLVEPRGVDRRVDQSQVRPGVPQAVDRALAAMRGAVVDDQEHALGLGGGLDRHELLDELAEGLDAVLGGAAIEDPGTADIPGGQLAERSLALVLVLDPQAAARRSRQRLMLAGSGLDRGLLVGANDEVPADEPGRGSAREFSIGGRRAARARRRRAS
jgi:hypothetical protein